MDVDHLWSFFRPWAYAAAAFGAIRMLYRYWLKPRFLRPVNSVIKSFNGKVVLITGASQGIGEALARSFHAGGAKLILTARSIDKLKVLCEELNESNGNDLQPAEYRYLDVTEPNGMDELVSLSPNGKIDILVHNAGIATYAACNDASDSAVRKQMEVNFFAPVNLTRMMEPHLSRGAVIVVVNSLQGLFAIPFRSAYGASKHALKAYFDSYRAEHSEDRHVLCVCPGYVNTNLALNAIGGDGKVIGSASDAVLSRGISPSEVASATLSSLQRGDSELVLGPFHHRAAALLRVVASDAYFAVMARRARDKVGAVDAHKKDR